MDYLTHEELENATAIFRNEIIHDTHRTVNLSGIRPVGKSLLLDLAALEERITAYTISFCGIPDHTIDALSHIQSVGTGRTSSELRGTRPYFVFMDELAAQKSDKTKKKKAKWKEDKTVFGRLNQSRKAK